MSSSVPSKRPVNADIVAEARKRAAEIAARINAPKQPTIGSDAAPSPATAAADRAAALKARIAAAVAKAGQRTSEAPTAYIPPPPSASGLNDARGDNDIDKFGRGAPMGLHPALMGKTALQVRQDEIKKDGRAGTRQRDNLVAPGKAVANPYLADSSAATGPTRKKRELHFNHNMNERPAMAAANEMRRKAQMEEMKRKIDEKTRAAGLDDGIPISVFAVAAPPEVEWWDEGIHDTDLDTNPLITNLILHPIPIEPPQDRYIELKPSTLRLTAKEQKKMRRIRRREEHKEEQDKIRLGLVPQPEPKVNHKNVMRVYGEMAVKDPTRVEALVNRQIRDRKETHEEANASRALTKEQKAEKRQGKAAANAAMGLNMTVYRITLNKETLLNKHRYLINMNAQQRSDITGVVLVGPSICLAVVEAGEHSTKQYQKLMLRRIKWQAILAGGGDIEHAPADDVPDGDGIVDKSADQTCQMLWQGQVRERRFKKWGGLREVETELQAVDALKRFKLETFWTLAKSSGPVTT